VLHSLWTTLWIRSVGCGWVVFVDLARIGPIRTWDAGQSLSRAVTPASFGDGNNQFIRGSGTSD
jgi:hypothetical protein